MTINNNFDDSDDTIYPEEPEVVDPYDLFYSDDSDWIEWEKQWKAIQKNNYEPDDTFYPDDCDGIGEEW